MLYCPKCQQSYEEGAQRFCTNDGSRLAPAPNSPKSAAGANGVFANFVGRRASDENIEDKFAALPRFSALDQLETEDFTTPDKKTFFADGDEIELEIEPQEFSVKPSARNVKPNEVPSGTAEIGNRKINPVNRAAFSRENPNGLIGQTVKGRYEIVALLGEDETSLAYLAEDRLAQRKKALVRVLTDADDLSVSLYTDEIVSLSHINHPNISRVIDSGELVEGNLFIVSEYADADSVRDLMKKAGQLNAQRAARIVRQVAAALGEAHQNGIVHRNLKPECILLTVNESGAEQVKLTNFGTAGNSFHSGNLAYKAPEILEGEPATRAGDIYSLAVIAYQILTNRLPFSAENARDLLKAQRGGVSALPTNLRRDLPASVDAVLEKALAFEPSARYVKARDFGDAFSNALLNSPVNSTARNADETPTADLFAAPNEQSIPQSSTFFPVEPEKSEREIFARENETTANFSESFDAKTAEIAGRETAKPETQRTGNDGDNDEDFVFDSGAFVAPHARTDVAETKTGGDLWTRRSPEPPKNNSVSFTLLSLAGLAVLLAAALGVWFYSVNRQAEPEFAVTAPQPNASPAQTAITAPIAAVTEPSPAASLGDIETPPLPRRIEQPPDTVYFQNSKQNLKGDLLKNFLGFSLYYPQSWKVNQIAESGKQGGRGKFLDISTTKDGNLSEQMLVSYYDSRGTFKEDAARFPQLVAETNETLESLIPNYRTLSEGETTINGGWRAYEVKFQGGGIVDGEKMIVWGRRLFIPASRSGARSGYEITMLATSLAPDVQSVDDVGTKGELAAILQTFEPNGNF